MLATIKNVIIERLQNAMVGLTLQAGISLFQDAPIAREFATTSTQWYARAHNQNGWTQDASDSDLPIVQPSIKLEDLPAELILSVMDVAGATDALCLALTCKRNYQVLRQHSHVHERVLDESELQLLLERLEKDTPGIFYCMRGQVLVSLYPVETQKPFPCILPSTHDCCPIDPQLSFRPDVYPGDMVFFGTPNQHVLTFCSARAVTNHAVLGPHAGVPASTLAVKYPTVQMGVCTAEESWQARTTITTKELMLSSTRSWTFASEDLIPKFLAQLSDQSMYAIWACHHHRPHALGGTMSKNRLNNRFNGSPHTGQCESCHTQWALALTWSLISWGTATLTLTTWHNLGPCRSPVEDKWRRSRAIFPPPRLNYEKDALRKQWEQDTDVDVQ
ncbi:hypothetical protein Micbo1qcDRAFT_178099 [Microdochium bolleyi]|uniref:F-box domain-containing protein n=1 Tax=Microdochium bolleyi TaxID=196109 RepID=A0A136IU80_9PEZI|nr:hypothetical protein Micbo1qcDRAFT_178099 [Microdochium bolleyi]